MADEIRFDRRDRDSTLDALEEILELSAASQTEVVLRAESSSLTRFAGNRIHQNVSETACKLSVRSIENGCVGYSSTNRFDNQSLRNSLEWARNAALSGRKPAEPAGLAGPQEYTEILNYCRATAEMSPDKRAGIVGSLIEECSAADAEAAGAISDSENILAIANSSGLRAYHALTDSNFTATVSTDGSTGWCDSYATDVSELESGPMGRRALERALAGRDRRRMEPGRYTVILEEAAVKDFVDFLCWLGFGAQAFEEGRSFMCNRIGEKITGDNVTISDDVYNPLGSGFPFDYEGIPRQRVPLIEGGIARNVVYDRVFGGRAGRPSTGHALPAGMTYGPLPLNVNMEPGASSVADMIRSVKRGILVSRLWYCRVVDPAKTLLTGQTRDGTFLIEEGTVVCGVSDMRFNESVLEAFSRAELISSGGRRIGSTVVPAMKISDFRFTENVG